MSNSSSKTVTQQSADNAIRESFNDVDKTLSVNGFVTAKVGHKITLSIGTTSITNDTETYSFFDSSTLLYTLVIIYTDGTRNVLVSVERTV